MIVGIFESLVYNAALLLALAITYDVIITRKFDSRIMVKIYTGLIIAAIGLGVMLHPLVLQEGIVFDARTILFSITAMFFGPFLLSSAALSPLFSGYRWVEWGFW